MYTDENKVLDLENEGGAVWNVRPFQLVSLWDMIKIRGYILLRMSAYLAASADLGAPEPSPNEKVSIKSKKIVGKQLSSIAGHCKDVGFNFSSKYAEALLKNLSGKGFTELELRRSMFELFKRIEDEISSALLMQIPEDRAKYYDKPALFGQQVADKFTNAAYDISEAGSCYATDRYTACVMHLMRALEVALDAVGLGVGLPNAVIEARNNWGALLTKISNQITANDGTSDTLWPPKRQFFVDAHAHLFTVKNAWRNPSMHLEKKYDDKEAIRIYNAVKDFMEHLATHLDASGTFTP